MFYMTGNIVCFHQHFYKQCIVQPPDDSNNIVIFQFHYNLNRPPLSLQCICKLKSLYFYSIDTVKLKHILRSFYYSVKKPKAVLVCTDLY